MTDERADYLVTYDDEWRNIIEPNGSFDKDQLKKELHDYSFLMRQASAVYYEVTGNRMSKTGYYADDVIRCFHERLEEWIDEAVKERDAEAIDTPDDTLREWTARWVAYSERWFPDVHAHGARHTTRHMALGLAGEAGEVANVVKKVERGNELDRDALASELADVLIYTCLLASSAGIDLIDAAIAKTEENRRRWDVEDGDD